MNKFSTDKQGSIEDSDDIDLRDVIFKYLRHWRWFVASVLLFLAIGLLVYMKKDRVYDVSSSVLVKEDKGGSQKTGALGDLESLGLISTTSNIDNEIAVLSSPSLMKQVVSSLDLYTSYFQNGYFRDTEVYTGCPYKVSLLSIAPDEFPGTLILNIYKTDSGFELWGSHEQRKVTTDINVKLAKLPGEIDLPNNLGKLSVAYRELDSIISEDSETYHVVLKNVTTVAAEIVSDLKISPASKSASVLNISLSTLNSVKGVDILNQIVKTYNTNNVAENNEIAINTSKFIEDRLITINSELKDVEDKVVDYKTQQGITEIEPEIQMLVTQSTSIEQNKIQIESQLKTVEFVEAFLQKSENRDKLIPNLGIVDPTLSTLISQYNAALLAYERVEKSTGEANVSRIKAVEELKGMREGILISIRNQRQSISLSNRELGKQLSSISSRVKALPSQQRNLLEIMRQQQVKQTISVFLMQKLEETNLGMAATSDKARIITDPWTTGGFVQPDRNVIFLAFILIGLIIPVIVIFLREKMQLNIANRKELEQLSDVPVIAEIMKKEEPDTIVVKPNMTTPIVELFRTLRNNIQFLLNTENDKVLLVTSTVPGEGKTFISINIATSFTLSDKKVLLIGMDIRNPKLAFEMEFIKGAGLTSYLSGSESDWRSLLSKIDGFPDLDILQAGVIPPNPNELLMKPLMKKLITEARSIYDVIILDTAPIGVVSDTFLLRQHADVTLYVTRENVTPKQAIPFVNEVYADNKLPRMYMIINDVDLAKNKGRYGYGYTYGYGKKIK